MYFAFFVIAGAVAYGLIVATSTPTVAMDGPTHTQGETVTLGERTYQVTEISEESAGGGHGGGGGEATVTGTIAWTNQSAVVGTQLDNGSTLSPEDTAFEDPFLVATPNASSPSSFALVQQRNITALAAEDPALYDQTVTVDGVEHVTYRENDTNVPVETYFGPVETRTYEVGDTLRYQGNETTVDAVTADAVTLTRPGEETTEVELTEGGNFTVSGTTYFAHFSNASSVQILSVEEYYGSYDSQNERIETYHERKLGLWGIVDLSIAAAIILLGTAFLPVRG
jgi:hypothetical protein